VEELARDLIKLSGLKPDTDIKIEYAELRPGDKMSEELILDEERDPTDSIHKKIISTKPAALDHAAFDASIEELRLAAAESPEAVRAQLKIIVPNYRDEPVTNEY